MIPMTEVFGVTTDNALDIFENQYRIKLPEEYRAFLKQQNGGSPDLGGIDIPDWGESLVNIFNGISLQGDVSKVYDLANQIDRFSDRFPVSEVLIIADDPGGNKFFIGVSQERFGKIYFWAHDAWDDEAENCLPELIELASSFGEFIALNRK